MRILLSNDDGIHAPGLAALAKIAHELSDDVWIVAPEFEQSGASHSLTLHDPLRVRQVSDQKFAVRGTPTDCVMMAVNHIVKDKKPDLILSGVNRGANLGEDVTYSGTIAAAMEGTLLGIPSIALSQCLTAGSPVKWATAEHHGPAVIRKLLEVGWPREVLVNINFPDVPHDMVKGILIANQGQRDASDLFIDERRDARGVPYYWLGFRRDPGTPLDGTDLYATANGSISVTPLHLDLTHGGTAAAFKKALA